MKKKEGKDKNKEEFNLRLRPHHIFGYLWHESAPKLYELPDKEYIAQIREFKKDFHSDELVLRGREVIKKIHDNPDLKFKYVKEDIDSICEGCEHSKSCANPASKYYKIVEQADNKAIKTIPELEPGKIYDGNYLKRLFIQKGLLKQEK